MWILNFGLPERVAQRMQPKRDQTLLYLFFNRILYQMITGRPVSKTCCLYLSCQMQSPFSPKFLNICFKGIQYLCHFRCTSTITVKIFGYQIYIFVTLLTVTVTWSASGQADIAVFSCVTSQSRDLTCYIGNFFLSFLYI